MMTYTETLQKLHGCLKRIEQHCPCGARPESLATHPHVVGCPVEEALMVITDFCAVQWSQLSRLQKEKDVVNPPSETTEA